jgi:hypothetical protein
MPTWVVALLCRPRCTATEREAPPPPSLGPARDPAGPSGDGREGRTEAGVRSPEAGAAAQVALGRGDSSGHERVTKC